MKPEQTKVWKLIPPVVKLGDQVPKVVRIVQLCKWDPYYALIFGEIDGEVEYKDIEGIIFMGETDSQTVNEG